MATTANEVPTILRNVYSGKGGREGYTECKLRRLYVHSEAERIPQQAVLMTVLCVALRCVVNKHKKKNVKTCVFVTTRP